MELILNLKNREVTIPIFTPAHLILLKNKWILEKIKSPFKNKEHEILFYSKYNYDSPKKYFNALNNHLNKNFQEFIFWDKPKQYELFYKHIKRGGEK